MHMRMDNVRPKFTKDLSELKGSCQQLLDRPRLVKMIKSNPILFQQRFITTVAAGERGDVSGFVLFDGKVNRQIDYAVTPIGKMVQDM